MRNPVGVIVARFQTPELHRGHRFLINQVASRHDQVLVVLGQAGSLATERDPLDFETRKAMVGQAYPEIRITKLDDCHSDRLWSDRLDKLLDRELPDQEAILYGSRASFIPHYSGRRRCVTLDAIQCLPATEFRNHVSIPRASRAFREGMIYAARRRQSVAYQTVDIAVLDHDQGRVLLGAKREDDGKLRFIGGFVDPADPSLELAAKREVREEASFIEVDNLRYLGSLKIDDWRYEGTKDGVMTALFAAHFVFGCPRASDDLDDLIWTPWDNFLNQLAKSHVPLGEMVQKHIARIVKEGLK